MYGIGLSYILIDTEFKKTEQRLGVLEQYAVSIRNLISKIDSHLLFLVEKSTEKLNIKTINIDPFYNDNVISGAEFRAIIINHHYLDNPHLHILYTVLKYNIINKEFYFDLFISNTQYVKKNIPLIKRYYPQLSETILKAIKFDIENTHLLVEKIKIIKLFVYNSTKENINVNLTRIHLKIQKSINNYLKNKQIINDTQLKLERKTNLDEINPQTTYINNDIYNFALTKIKNIVEEKKILADKNYSVIATSINLLNNNIIFEKAGEDDKHAESLLIADLFKNNEMMDGFRRQDLIFVVRLYKNGSIGNGLPCQRCVRILCGNGINKVVFSIDKNNYKVLDMNENTYTYTTTGNKLLHVDTYLYEKYVSYRRLREE